jgi:hypothetical protein
MLGKWFSKSKPKPEADAGQGPYPSGLNELYELLFCDDLERYRNAHRGPMEGVWSTLLGSSFDEAALRSAAEDPGLESRLRALAFLRLRQQGLEVPKRKLLGVVLEVGLPGGLDTLAAYPDHRARYFNHSGKLLVWEVPGADPEVDGAIDALISAGQQVVDRIGPWDKPRRPAPGPSSLRMSFVVSDGLYFGEGPMKTLQVDPMGGPVIAHGTKLLQLLVSKGPRD